MKEVYLLESATKKHPDAWQTLFAWNEYNAAKDALGVLQEIQPHLKHRITIVDLYEKETSCKTK